MIKSKQIRKHGLITKGVGGLYHVLTADGFYFCYARGLFRNKKGVGTPVAPLVGDKAEILIDSEAERTGTIYALMPRANVLKRPAAANTDRVIVTAAAAQPAFHPGLLDRFLVLAARAGIDAVLCITKTDLARDTRAMAAPYEMAGYTVLFTSVKEAETNPRALDALRGVMAGKVSIFAGASGVGKSSLINALLPHARLETGVVSAKGGRGKHTTRAAEILLLGDTLADGCVIDTPGFSSLDTDAIPPREIAAYYKEFAPYAGQCKFNDCLHGPHDPSADCAVKAHLNKTIHPARYESYLALSGQRG